MFESIYTGLSGLLGFSKGLDNISNNVANLNTPGFKSSQLQFQDLYYQYRMEGENPFASQLGTGVGTGNTSLRFAPGELRDTGNDTDAAIDGNGFFILRKDGEVFYSRVGQFEFDENGFLIARSNNARVAGLVNGASDSANGGTASGIYSGGVGVAGGSLQDINITGFRTRAATATTEIKFLGNLLAGSTNGAPNTHPVNNITVYDSRGTTHTLKAVFTSNGTDTTTNNHKWLVDVTDETNAPLVTSKEIQFRPDGSPETGFNTISFSYTPNGAFPADIILNFGDPGGRGGATSLSGPSSDLKMGSQNGIPPGSLTKITFDADGYLVAAYSNGQSDKPARLALAWFNYLQGLQETGGNLFVNNTKEEPRIAPPGADVMGKLAGKKIELSNVELTQQFTDMIIIQRGYQGSSQIISVANEMIQQLFDLRKR